MIPSLMFLVVVVLLVIAFIFSYNNDTLSSNTKSLIVFLSVAIFCINIFIYFIEKPSAIEEEKTIYVKVINKETELGDMRSYIWVNGYPIEGKKISKNNYNKVFPDSTVVKVSFRETKSKSGMFKYLPKQYYEVFTPNNPEYESVLAKVKEE